MAHNLPALLSFSELAYDNLLYQKSLDFFHKRGVGLGCNVYPDVLLQTWDLPGGEGGEAVAQARFVDLQKPRFGVRDPPAGEEGRGAASLHGQAAASEQLS